MIKIRPLTKKRKINASEFVNVNTGEELSSQLGGVLSVNVPDEGFVIIESDNFYIVEADALAYVSRVLPPQDFEKLCKMMSWVYGEYNYLCDPKGNPYTKPEVMNKLSYSRSRFDALIRRLHSEGIVFISSGYKEKKAVKYIMLNPSLARKRKKLSVHCTQCFDDLTKK